MKPEDIKIGQKYKMRLFKDVVYLGVGHRPGSSTESNKLVIIEASENQQIGYIVSFSNDYSRSVFFDCLYEI